MPKTDYSAKEIKRKELCIEHLKIYFDRVNFYYESGRSRAIIFLGGEFAVLVYLFSDGDFISRIFQLGDATKIIFFLLGITLLIISLISLFIAIRPVYWASTIGPEDIKKMKINSYLDLLDYLENEHLEALKINRSHLTNKQRYFDIGSFLLIIGAVLLIVMKQFN